MKEKEYITVKEAAEFFKVHENTIYHWIKKGQLKADQVGGLIRIPASSLQDMAKPIKGG